MDKAALEFLKTRRSIRAFKPDQIDEGTLDAILEAGVYAPTGMGAQSPVIAVVRDSETRGQLTRMNAKVLGKTPEEVDPYYGAPAILVAFAPPDGHTYIEDATSVLIYIQLAAHAAGLGAVWVHREREMFESEEGKGLLKKWGLPTDLAGIGAVALGHADCEAPAPAARKSGYVIKV
ncbi:MAG: nitroreductase family protein [Clostridiales Family XIII bacterium]|jgi:nitroreductase|nr:nitroreductase family protein [Clostridiales Family XIII bacterium]